MDVLAMSKQYNTRPSAIVFIDDEYTAYCFDKACMYMISQIIDKKQPHFPEDIRNNDTLRKLEAGII